MVGWAMSAGHGCCHRDFDYNSIVTKLDSDAMDVGGGVFLNVPVALNNNVVLVFLSVCQL